MREVEGAASSTIRRRLAALSSLYKHLVRHSHASRNPVGEVERPAINRDEGAREVERNVSSDNDFSLRRKLLQKPQPVVGQSAMSTQQKARTSAAVYLLAFEQLRSAMARTTLIPLRIVELRSRLVSADVDDENAESLQLFGFWRAQTGRRAASAM